MTTLHRPVKHVAFKRSTFISLIMLFLLLVMFAILWGNLLFVADHQFLPNHKQQLVPIGQAWQRASGSVRVAPQSQRKVSRKTEWMALNTT